MDVRKSRTVVNHIRRVRNEMLNTVENGKSLSEII